MPLFDTHCHLDFPAFDADRDRVLERCRQTGIERILLPGVEAAHWERLLSISAQDQRLLPSLGLHPGFTARHREADLERLDRLLGDGRAVAVGEIGLDYWEGRDEEARQAYFFEAQLELARAHGLPVLLHVRKAHDQVLKRLRQWALPQAGVAHAFSASQQQAEQYLALGFRLGLGGGLTYSRAKRLRQQAASLPLGALVLETDAPDMPLCGHQGERNRPDRLAAVLDTLVALRSEPREQIIERLWANSLALVRGEPFSS